MTIIDAVAGGYPWPLDPWGSLPADFDTPPAPNRSLPSTRRKVTQKQMVPASSFQPSWIRPSYWRPVNKMSHFYLQKSCTWDVWIDTWIYHKKKLKKKHIGTCTLWAAAGFLSINGTSPKIQMEPENGGLVQMIFLVNLVDFPCQSWGVKYVSKCVASGSLFWGVAFSGWDPFSFVMRKISQNTPHWSWY